MKNKTGALWQNSIKKQQTRPKRYLLPESVAEVVEAVREAEQAGLRVRAVGGGHSFNASALTPDVLLDLREMCEVREVDGAMVKEKYKGLRLVEADAGISLQRLNRLLDRMGLAMRTLGAIDEQSIAGAAATATHGCSPEQPPLTGVIRALHLVASNGRRFQIEPQDGITDPTSFQDPVIQLIQDDRSFQAALLHMGAFGIVTGLCIEVEPQYYLLESRRLSKWSSVKTQVQSGSLFARQTVRVGRKSWELKPYGLNLFINPYAMGGDHSCLLGYIFRLPEKPRRGLLARTRNIVTHLASATRIPYKVLERTALKSPEKIPQRLEMGLKAIRDRSFVSKSYKVWLQGMEYNAKKGFGSEFAHPNGNGAWVAAMDKVLQSYGELAADGRYAPGVPLIRFSSGSSAMLCPTQQADSVWIGAPMLVKYPPSQGLLDHFQDLHHSLGGKVHWGKINNRVTPDLLADWYPRLVEWQAEMRKFNPDGTFDNAFTKRIGLT